MFKDMTIGDFLARTKSAAPVPGGGSASALVGAIGTALAIMLGNLTVDNEKYQGVKAEVETIKGELEKFLLKFEAGMEDDVEAFNRVIAAYKLPKVTEEEKNARARAIQDALKEAACPPMRIAQYAAKVLELAVKMLKTGNVSAASDAAVAGKLVYAAMWGSIYNVRINLQLIKDEGFVDDMRTRIKHLEADSAAVLLELESAADRIVGI